MRRLGEEKKTLRPSEVKKTVTGEGAMTDYNVLSGKERKPATCGEPNGKGK